MYPRQVLAQKCRSTVSTAIIYFTLYTPYTHASRLRPLGLPKLLG